MIYGLNLLEKCMESTIRVGYRELLRIGLNGSIFGTGSIYYYLGYLKLPNKTFKLPPSSNLLHLAQRIWAWVTTFWA